MNNDKELQEISINYSGKKDVDISELDNQNIDINTQKNPSDERVESSDKKEVKSGPNSNSGSGSNSNNKEKDKSGNPIEEGKKVIAESLVQSATEEMTQAWFEKIKCSLEPLRKYFDVKSSDILYRLLHSLIPFNPKFFELTNETPDVYGPFWIFTTLIFVTCAAGSIAHLIWDSHNTEFYQEFVPIAAFIIYGLGFGLPLLLTAIMKCFGGEEVKFASMLCIYGYSFTIFIPSLVICVAPFEWLQWILIGYAVVSSTGFLLVNYWRELSKFLEKKKYILLAIVFVFQLAFFCVLKFYFFEKLTAEINNHSGNSTISNNTIENNTMTNTTLHNHENNGTRYY